VILSPRAPASAPMEKSPEAYRTIREVADSLDLPQHVLRFWETRFPQIRPLKRAGGRRYYRPDDIERLRLIKRLLYDEGYTIKGVQKLFKEQGVQAQLIWMIASGVLVFGDWPTVPTLLGAALVVACGAYLALRERRGRQVARAVAIDADRKV
jgi:DNA-binding transcriptional MerR regulator